MYKISFWVWASLFVEVLPTFWLVLQYEDGNWSVCWIIGGSSTQYLIETWEQILHVGTWHSWELISFYLKIACQPACCACLCMCVCVCVHTHKIEKRKFYHKGSGWVMDALDFCAKGFRFETSWSSQIFPQSFETLWMWTMLGPWEIFFWHEFMSEKELCYWC
jgi:hypothetical protein